jgi:hypothetical protein
MKYYKIKYSCGCEYEGHNPSSPRCPSDHNSNIVEYAWEDDSLPVEAKVSNANGGDLERQEQLLGLLYRFAECQKNKIGKEIRYTQKDKNINPEIKHIYSVGDYLGKILELFGKKVIPID